MDVMARLEEEVRRKLSPTEKYLVDDHRVHAAVAVLALRGVKLSRSDKYYGSLVEVLREMDRESRSEELSIKATDRLFGKALVRALAPKIADLRREGFANSPDPPCKTVAEAAQWVEQRSKADLAEWREDSEQRKKARAEINRLADKYRIEIQEKATQIRYQKPGDEHVRWVHAVPGTYLHRLAVETDRMAAQCGIPQAALVSHVLTGLEPARSRATLATRGNWYTLPSGEQIGVNEATVIIRARDLTDKELRAIYGMIRGYVGGKGTKGMRDEDVDFWELVQDEGGPPQGHGGKGQFWERVRQRWNREHPDDQPYTTSDSVRIRYERIADRLRPRQVS
jgi:hypothetical protein